uniref:Reverse transcriptase Ty1/copia-type domain-containing protein n=1 Tax=Tanacetum cinerariifolium TaxID=118510 RepID=A0A6L2J4K9_TANCI|nr:hypothetical protein [Tanacetum cinerariifolium]
MDVKSAFLYERIKEEVYVCQPPGFKDPDYPDKVYKVEKALYGLHQASRAWYETLARYLLDNGFHRGKIDQTMFIKRQKGNILLVQVYIDDIIFRSTKKELCTDFEELMHHKFQMSLMGELAFFLGLQTASTLMDQEKAFLKDSDGDDVDVHLYKYMIRSLMYLTSSRPDIMFGLNETIDGQDKTITEASVMRHLKLADADGISTLPTAKNFEQLALMRVKSNVPSSVADEAITKEMHDGLGRATTTASSLEAEQGSGNISKTQTKATPSRPISLRTSSEGSLGCHVTIRDSHVQARPERLSNLPNEPPLGEVNTPRSREGNIQLLELMDICTKLSDKLEKKLKHKRRRAVIDSSKDEKESLGHENSPKHGRMIEEFDEDENVNLVQSTKDKGKAIMQESEPSKKIKEKEMIQISLNEEIAQRFYEEEQEQLLIDKEYAQQVQAHWIQADEDLAQRILKEERESLSIKERSRLLTEFIDKRKKMLVVKRAEEKRNKPPTQAQQRTHMSNYIKNIGGYTLKQLKQYSFKEIKMLFDNTIEGIRKFVPMESQGQVAYSKAGEGSSKDGECLKRHAKKEKEKKKDAKSSKHIEEEIAQQEDVVAKQAVK